MKRKSILFILPFIALVLMSCQLANISINQQTLRGSGNLKTETRSVSNVQRVSLEDRGNLTIVQGNEEGLTVQADDNILPYLQSQMRGNELVLGLQSGYNLSSDSTVNYTLKVKDLSNISISGSGDVTGDQFKTENLTVNISGSGNVKFASLQVNSLNMRASGSGNFNLKGNATSQDITITGSGNYNAGDLKTSNTQVNVSGSGNVTVWTTDQLGVHVTGFGNVNYYGTPTLSQTITGSGSVKSLGQHQ